MVHDFVYDSGNRRIAIRKNAEAYRYDIHDGNICIASIKNGTIDQFFVRGSGIAEGTGDILAEWSVSGTTWSPHFYVANHRGDTLQVLADDGDNELDLRYDAFGNPVSSIQHQGSFSPRYTFSTKEYLADVGGYLYRYRFYDCVAGRWTQRDPIDYQDSVNLYQFCGNNPVNGWDVDGQHFFRQPGQPPKAGRDDSNIVQTGGRIGTIVDDYVPAGYTFAVAHDWLVGSLTIESQGPIIETVSDAIVNIPTMVPMYAVAVVAEITLPEFVVGWFVDNEIAKDTPVPDPPVPTPDQDNEEVQR